MNARVNFKIFTKLLKISSVQRVKASGWDGVSTCWRRIESHKYHPWGKGTRKTHLTNKTVSCPFQSPIFRFDSQNSASSFFSLARQDIDITLAALLTNKFLEMNLKAEFLTFAIAISSLLGFTSCSEDDTTIAPETPTTTEAHPVKDVAYVSTSIAQKMDVDVPAGTGPFPAVVLIHGGAFKAGDKAMEATNAAKLVANGYAAISINYRLSGEAVFPAGVHDAKAAVRFVRANASTYRINPDKIRTWGASAGGYFSAILGTSGGDAYLEGTEGSHLTTSSEVQACIDWFGPINFSTMVAEGLALGFASTYNVDNESQFLGVDANSPSNIDIVDKASPTTYIDVNDPPFWIQVGSVDPLIPYTQSLNFYNSLNSVLGSSKVGYELINGAGHGGSLFSTEANLAKAIAFLDSQLK